MQDEQDGPDSQVLIPQFQDAILFHEKPLIVVRLPNGEHGVVLRWICENLHLGPKAQVDRIKRTESIADSLIYVRVQTEGGPQVMPALVLRAVPYWLATIDTRRMAKDDPRRQEVIEYQRNAVDALYAWAASVREVSSSDGLVSSEPMNKPERPAQDAPRTEWRDYFRQMANFLDWQLSITEWQGTVEGRLDTLETVTSRIIQQIGPARLTPAQQTLVQHYVSELSTLTKKPHATFYAALKTRFRVPRYDEIPAVQWPEVVAWFARQFPGGALPVEQASWMEE